MLLDRGFFGWFYTILRPIEAAMAYVIKFFHDVLTAIGLSGAQGLAWSIAVMLLVVLVKLIIFPLFVRQMLSMRKMQALQPQLQKIQKKYKGKTDRASREAMSRETMKVYQDNHANPMGSCVPSLIQGPIFMAMFYTLSAVTYIADGRRGPLGAFDKAAAQGFSNAQLFNIKLSSTFATADSGGKVTIGIFVALMCLTMFYSQWHNVRRNMPKASMQGTAYRTQMLMSFIFPVMYIFSGITFPFAVLVYWLTNNIWTLGQTLWQVYNMPTPGSPAAEAKEKRDYRKEQARRERAGEISLEEEELLKAKEAEERLSVEGHQRKQPSRKKKKK